MKKLILGFLLSLFAFSQIDAAYYIIRGNVQLGNAVGDTLKVPGVFIVDSTVHGRIDSAVHADTADAISSQNFRTDTISVFYILPKAHRIRFISSTRDTVDLRKMMLQVFDTTAPGAGTQVSVYNSTFMDTSTGSINGVYSLMTKKNPSPATNTVRGFWSSISDAGDSIANAAGLDVAIAGGKSFVAGVKIALTSTGSNATSYGIYVTGADTALYANTGNIILVSGFLECDSVVTPKVDAGTGNNLILSGDSVIVASAKFCDLSFFWHGGPGAPLQFMFGQGPDGRRVDFARIHTGNSDCDTLQVDSLNATKITSSTNVFNTINGGGAGYGGGTLQINSIYTNGSQLFGASFLNIGNNTLAPGPISINASKKFTINSDTTTLNGTAGAGNAGILLINSPSRIKSSGNDTLGNISIDTITNKTVLKTGYKSLGRDTTSRIYADTLVTSYTCAYYATIGICTVAVTTPATETLRIVDGGTGSLWTDSCGSAYTTHDSGSIILALGGGYRYAMTLSGYTMGTNTDTVEIGLIRKRGAVKTVLKHPVTQWCEKDNKLFNVHLQCVDATAAAGDTVYPYMINRKDADDTIFLDGTWFIEQKKK